MEKNINNEFKKTGDLKKENQKKISMEIFIDEFFIVFTTSSLLIYWFFIYFNFTFGKSIFYDVLIFFSFLGVLPVIWSVIKAFINKSITVDLLAGIALFFTFFRGEWISAAFINLMLASARLFSAMTQKKAEQAISGLLKLRPTRVKVLVGQNQYDKPLEEVSVGDVVVVETGDRIPIDGQILRGEAEIDQSTITGESLPVSKKIGDDVLSSTLCVSGSLFVLAKKVGENTELAKIIALVDEASRAKTKLESVANRFSAWYILATLVVVVIIYFFTRNISLVLSILLVTCADDLAVAIPLGFTIAMAKAARHGIIIKGATVMERLKDIKIFVTDKTGTLTLGAAKIIKVFPENDSTVSECLEAAALCSLDSKHPIAKAILDYAKKDGVKIKIPDEVEEKPGQGIFAKYQNRNYLNGKVSFLQSSGVKISESLTLSANKERDFGRSINMVAVDGRALGFFVLEDNIRKFAKEVILETKSLGVKKWIMLTGDNSKVAERVSKDLGINEYFADLKPTDKLNHLKELRQKKEIVAMIGDGVNDAAALALADVSFAMGSIGSDSAITAADIALMHDDLRRVPESILLSKKTITIVRQNIIIWAVTNTVGLVLALNGLLGPAGASFYNFLTDFIPIFNVFKIMLLKINKHTYDDVK